MTRCTLRISSISCSCVGSRPAVSARTTSMPRAVAARDRVEHHGAGIAACLRDHRDAVALAPDRELLARGRAERVAGGEQHRVALRLEDACASLPIDVVLPAPFTPASMITNGRAAPIDERPLERREEIDQRRLEQRLRIGVARPRASSARDRSSSRCCGRGDADVGGDERGLELLQRLGVELAAREHAARARRRASRASARGRPRAARSRATFLGRGVCA